MKTTFVTRDAESAAFPAVRVTRVSAFLVFGLDQKFAFRCENYLSSVTPGDSTGALWPNMIWVARQADHQTVQYFNSFDSHLQKEWLQHDDHVSHLFVGQRVCVIIQLIQSFLRML